MKRFLEPPDVTHLQGFPRMCQYFQKYFEGFALIAEALYDSLKKDAAFQFAKSQINTSVTLRKKLMSAPIFAIYNPRNPTKHHCDATFLGFNSVSLQQNQDKRFHPIFFFLKRNTECESR